MINLLPEQFFKEARAKLRKKALAFGILGVGLAFLISGAVMFSGSLLISFQESALAKEEEALLNEKAQVENESFSVVINEIKDKLSLFRERGYQVIRIPSDVVLNIEEALGDGVRLAGIFYQVKDTLPQVELRGTTTDRDELLQFVKNLRTIDGFQNVEIPLSYFAKRDQLDFVVTFYIAYEDA